MSVNGDKNKFEKRAVLCVLSEYIHFMCSFIRYVVINKIKNLSFMEADYETKLPKQRAAAELMLVHHYHNIVANATRFVCRAV